MACAAWVSIAGAQVLPARWNGTIVRVIDGDSCIVRAVVWPAMTIETEIRLLGVDTPESAWRAHCPAERLLAQRATAALAAAFPIGSAVQLGAVEPDKYGGRWLAVVIGPTGASAQEVLLTAGLAAPYTGRGPRKDWCAVVEAREGGSRAASDDLLDTAGGRSPFRRGPLGTGP